MKTLRCFSWLVAAAIAASLPVTVQAAAGQSMGGHVGAAPHFSGGRGFGHGFGRFDHRHDFAFRHHDFDRFRHHGFDRDRDFDRDDRFFRHHFFADFDFVSFGFPWWYPYYLGYPYDYSYYDYQPAYDYQYWTNLAVSVQSELARRGYYRGAIDGVIGSGSRQAIRAFQAANGLPVSGMIDPNFLKALGISYRSA
jgi:hypothetical protein